MNEQFINELATALRKVGTIHTVGEEWVSYIGEIPNGGVPYCGQEVTRTTYSALWAYAQSKGLVKTEAEWKQIATANGGNVPYYSNGNGSTTFRMPKLNSSNVTPETSVVLFGVYAFGVVTNAGELDVSAIARDVSDAKMGLNGVVRSINGLTADADGEVSVVIPPAYVLPTATSSVIGGVKVGSNITNTDGKISLSKSNVTTALGYTPVKSVNGTAADASGNVPITIPSGWTVSKGANGWARDSNTGFTIFWGKGSAITKGKYGDWYTPKTWWATLTYPKTMTTILHVVPYAVVTSHSADNIGIQACAKSITTKNFIHGLVYDVEANVTAYPAYVGFGIS